MQIVIDIPEEIYKASQLIDVSHDDTIRIPLEVITNSIPLPKGHGRLVDADVLGEKLNRYTEAPYQYALAVFNESPTIIEADKAESEVDECKNSKWV